MKHMKMTVKLKGNQYVGPVNIFPNFDTVYILQNDVGLLHV